LANEKEKHTTYTIGPVSRIRMLEVMKRALREALKERFVEDISIVWRYAEYDWPHWKPPLRIHPRWAEETPDGTIIFSDLERKRVVEIDYPSGDKLWEYSTEPYYPNAVHKLEDGNIIIGLSTESYVPPYGGKVVIVSPDGRVIWEYERPGTSVFDAVFVSDTEILITHNRPPYSVEKITYPGKSVIWFVDVSAEVHPRGIFIPTRQHMGWNLAHRFGDTDYYIAGRGAIIGLRDSDQAVIWKYGQGPNNLGNAYNTVRVLANCTIGGSDTERAAMFFASPDYGCIKAINANKHVIWQCGYPIDISPYPGAPTDLMQPGTPFNTPDAICFTRRGTLLVADSGGSQIVEIDPHVTPRLPRNINHLFLGEEIRDTATHNSLVAETGFYPWSRVAITIENGLNQGVSIVVQGANDGEFTNPYTIVSAFTVTAGGTRVVILNNAYRFVRLTATCSAAPTSGSLIAYADMFE